MNNTRQSWMPMVVIALSMVMMYITSFGVNVLISAIVSDLNTTVSTLQLVIVSASLIAGSLMVTTGRLGDLFGTRQIFSLGVLLYTLGLLVVISSPSTTVFIIGWALIWPLGMVMVIPSSIALIMKCYHGSQRIQAFGIYGAVLSAVSALAPVVVGALSDQLGWRIALALSPAFGVITLLMLRQLPATPGDKSVRVDPISVVLSLGAFGLFLIATTMASHYGWLLEKRPLVLGLGETAISLFGLSPVPLLYLISAVIMALFLKRGARLKAAKREPLLDAALLRNKVFSAGMAIGALFFLANAGFLFAVSVYLQAGVKMDGLSTALTTLPYTASLAILSLTTPVLGRWLAPKWIIVIGSGVMMAGIWLTGAWSHMSLAPMELILPMLLVGSGAGLVMAQYTGVTMMTVKPEETGAASGLSETLKEIIGQGFAVALAGSVLFGSVYASMADSYAEQQQVTQSVEQHTALATELEDIFQGISEEQEQGYVSGLPESIRGSYQQIVNRAANRGLSDSLLTMNVVMLLTLLLALSLPAAKLEEAPPT